MVIPRFRYDGSYPITLEAIVQAPYRGTIVGSFDGSGLGLDVINGHCLFHVNDGRSENAGYATIKSHHPSGNQLHGKIRSAEWVK